MTIATESIPKVLGVSNNVLYPKITEFMFSMGNCFKQNIGLWGLHMYPIFRPRPCLRPCLLWMAHAGALIGGFHSHRSSPIAGW